MMLLLRFLVFAGGEKKKDDRTVQNDQ